MAFHPAYFQTRFQCVPARRNWPGTFGIITAHATTGQQWAARRNAAANARLALVLRAAGRWSTPLVGYSPSTGHAEAGWAVRLDIVALRRIGLHFRQDAIYWIEADQLWVARCRTTEREWVGRFRPRLSAGRYPAPLTGTTRRVP